VSNPTLFPHWLGKEAYCSTEFHPANISNRATVKVLTKSGFEVAQQGDNGNICMVMRGFSAPTYPPRRSAISYTTRPFLRGSPLPQLTDDAGTAFSVVVIPVDDKVAVGGEMK